MTAPVYALSLIQPWAFAVVHGEKSVENRTWYSEIRGPIWIHASAQVTRRYYDQAKEIIEAIGDVKVPPLKELDYGCIVGRATITGCILPEGRELGAKKHPLHPHPWHFIEQYGYVLGAREPVKPVPCKGHQRWWVVPPSVLEQLGVPT